jgi:hypothetical protein
VPDRTGTSPPGSADDGLVYGPNDANQEALGALSSYVSHSPQVDASGAGYIVSRHDVPNRSATLYFRDPARVPSVVRDEADRLGVGVSFTPWPYSLAETRTAARRITEAFNREQGRVELPDGFRVSDITTWDGRFAGVTLTGSYRDGRTSVPSELLVAELAEVAGVAVQVLYAEAWVDDSPAQRAVRDGLETITVSAGVGFRPERRLIKRDARRLLWALGEVERDLQGTLGQQWMLAMRSSLSVIAQNDGVGEHAMTTIAPGLDPAGLPDGALDPGRVESTLATDALDAVAYATHWLLYERGVHWPECVEHPALSVTSRCAVWVCAEHDHEIASVGQLAPRDSKRLRPDGTVDPA